MIGRKRSKQARKVASSAGLPCACWWIATSAAVFASRSIALLKEYDEVEAERVITDIASALPCDNPGKTFQTMIAWGRYAGLMDYTAQTGMVFVPKDEATDDDAGAEAKTGS